MISKWHKGSRSRKKIYHRKSYTKPNFVSVPLSDSVVWLDYIQSHFFGIRFLALKYKTLSKDFLTGSYKLRVYFGKLSQSLWG